VTGKPLELEAMNWEAQYNNRAAVPDHPAVMGRWKVDAELSRTARPPVELTYGDRPREVMDLWEVAPDAPLAIFIHGGYWQALDKAWFSWISGPLLAHGISVAIPSYDLCPEVSLGRIVCQMRAVAELLRQRTGARPFVFGHSAGGHLAACLLSEGRASGALALSGVFDLEPLILTSLNNALDLDVTTARALSPIHWTPPNGDTLGGAALDCLVGGAETAEFIRQSRAMADVWAAKGVRTRFEVIEGLNHFTVLDPLAAVESGLVKRIVAMTRAG
jgi:arylformamidase